MATDGQKRRREPKPVASSPCRPKRSVSIPATGGETDSARPSRHHPDASLFAIDDEGHLLWSDPEAISHLSSLDALDHDPPRGRLSLAWTQRLWSQVERDASSPRVFLIDPVTTGGCAGMIFWSPQRPTRLNALLVDRQVSGIQIDPAWDQILTRLDPPQVSPAPLHYAA